MIYTEPKDFNVEPDIINMEAKVNSMKAKVINVDPQPIDTDPEDSDMDPEGGDTEPEYQTPKTKKTSRKLKQQDAMIIVSNNEQIMNWFTYTTDIQDFEDKDTEREVTTPKAVKKTVVGKKPNWNPEVSVYNVIHMFPQLMHGAQLSADKGSKVKSDINKAKPANQSKHSKVSEQYIHQLILGLT